MLYAYFIFSKLNTGILALCKLGAWPCVRLLYHRRFSFFLFFVVVFIQSKSNASQYLLVKIFEDFWGLNWWPTRNSWERRENRRGWAVSVFEPEPRTPDRLPPFIMTTMFILSITWSLQTILYVILPPHRIIRRNSKKFKHLPFYACLINLCSRPLP